MGWLGVDGMQGTLASGLRGSGEFAAGLVVAFEAELADHAVEVAGQRGEVLEGFDGLLGALRIFDRELRDLAGGLGDFAGGGGLLGGGGGDQVDLVLDLLGGLDNRLQALAGVGGFAIPVSTAERLSCMTSRVSRVSS